MTLKFIGIYYKKQPSFGYWFSYEKIFFIPTIKRLGKVAKNDFWAGGLTLTKGTPLKTKIGADFLVIYRFIENQTIQDSMQAQGKTR